ncbi:TlpA family protein disulfide reductase [Cyclobacterium amurskyense]|uniref:Uncharacterized protein n=1 Tax=Cyclobacterium amurskyense TaxID=320787 RepID=A0A0H4PEQ9_9BACT|nr:redoxin domain-containing protein [Cyclobacterium amurskyense]AKP51580.1 hypothetical protein CA2015_2159 [Cyclobacterium amurskyense]
MLSLRSFLATDPHASLEAFLGKNVFDYVVFSDQEELIIDQLKLEAYPTHLVLDKNGNIKKIFNKGSELMAYIDENKSLFHN